MQYIKDIQIKYEVDVLVCGGGAAGVAAAVAAARLGKKTLIIEECGAFGGLGTLGMVPAFAPFYDGKNFVCNGIGLEIRKKVSRNIPLESYWSACSAEELKSAYDEIIAESGAERLFFTRVTDTVVTDRKIDYVVVSSKKGLFAIKAKTYVDCTGDGNVLAFGGAEFEMGDENGAVMPLTICSLYCDVDLDRAKQFHQDAFIEDAYEKGILGKLDRHLPGFFYRSGGFGGGNIGHCFDIDPLSEASLSDAMTEGRAYYTEYENYYKTYGQGFEAMKKCATASIPGIRESRRIVCDYMLNINDFLSRACFDDEIGRYCYPVDIHVADTSAKEYERFQNEYKTLRYKAGESYGIPYRSLVVKSFDNALVAGRCMGTDRQMQASIRVMPGCFITGEAAGAAAALSDGDVRSVDVKKLQAVLKNNRCDNIL